MNIEMLKGKIFNIIHPSDEDGGSTASKAFDMFIITLIIVNVAMVIADTFDAFGQFQIAFHIIEVFSVIVFTVEYILRMWTADLLYSDRDKVKAHIKYIFSFMALIDLFAILPFSLPFLPS